MKRKILTIIILGAFFFIRPVFSEEDKGIETLSLDEFIRIACVKDKVFEQVLIDNLKLKYRKKLKLPADDIVLSSKARYTAFLRSDKGNGEYEISLAKLFPFTGTEIEAGYNSTIRDTVIGNINAEFYAVVSQPVARNAFGRSNRLLDKIVGIEIDIAEYQIAEAYEHYLSSIIQIYYDWYESYENLKTAENSHKENLKLLKNVEEREKNNIALPVDVNKVRLQVLLKEEKLITVKPQFEKFTNLLKTSIGYDVEEELLPYPEDQYDGLVIDFQEEYEVFMEKSRTAMILDLLEDKSSLEVEKDADDLLPSIALFAEYAIKAADRFLEKDDKRVMAGVSLEYPFPGQVEHAEYETAKVEHQKSKLDKINTHIRIYTELRNIYDEIKKTRELIKIAREKVRVSQSIVDDDRINYSYGKVILNNFIDEVNQLDLNRFSEIQYTIRLKKLIVDWLSLTDQLIRRKDLGMS